MAANDGRFATTQWSLVLAAGGERSADAREALEQLCSIYWYPVFAYVRRRGHPVEEAEDMTQSFFSRLLEKGELASADRTRGRFRTFLLTACQNFLLNEHDRRTALKRGGGQAALSIDFAAAERRYQHSLAHEETPEVLYDRQWSLTLLGSVVDVLRGDYAAAGKGAIFDRLVGFLTMDDSAGSYAEVAADLDTTPAAIKVAVHRLRRRYRDALRRRIAETVDHEGAVDDELRHLMKTMSGV